MNLEFLILKLFLFSFYLESVSVHKNTKKKENQNFLEISFNYCKDFLIKLASKILVSLLKTIKSIFYASKTRVFFNFIFLTTLYLLNDLFQFVTIFIFIYYICRCFKDDYVLWQVRNAELIVDFVKTVS